MVLIIAYPKQETQQVLPIWEVVDTEKTIEMQMVRIDSLEHTLEDLREIMGERAVPSDRAVPRYRTEF
ncbi:hypothetical protein QNK12_15285 [Neobacillus cucumis]|nr:hypothetical protein QNK12_15285 [Neobacillus cucumis]